jgi:orotate phosphoribosyltransferase
MAYEVSRHLGVKNIFAERQDGIMTLRRGFNIEKDQKVLIVEDVITTGGSVKEVIEVVKNHGGNVIGVGVIVDRSGGNADFGTRLESVISIDVQSYTSEECPLCKQNIPVVKPGSRSV